MSEIRKDGLAFVGFDYMEIITNLNKVSFLIDGYKNFGWVVDDNLSHTTASNIPVSPINNVVLRLKRNRKIINKVELTRLQKNFEFCLKEINHLEQSRTSDATKYALIVGVIGTVFMAGSVFSVTSTPPIISLCIILAIPAVIGWITPYFLYKKILIKKMEKMDLLIEKRQDEIFELCEKGNKLLY